eukprot:TRINITY_DN2581_c0_g2_i2.p1 TRINITY_DN2581_c0_g2~~TRINITY_DN2581_c0_g2_i2.p1  ORF type:complete len:326 (+),score=47.58 TRINITY_DN2581_c0_g2_i2:252-1229(+)
MALTTTEPAQQMHTIGTIPVCAVPFCTQCWHLHPLCTVTKVAGPQQVATAAHWLPVIGNIELFATIEIGSTGPHIPEVPLRMHQMFLAEDVCVFVEAAAAIGQVIPCFCNLESPAPLQIGMEVSMTGYPSFTLGGVQRELFYLGPGAALAELALPDPEWLAANFTSNAQLVAEGKVTALSYEEERDDAKFEAEMPSGPRASGALVMHNGKAVGMLVGSPWSTTKTIVAIGIDRIIPLIGQDTYIPSPTQQADWVGMQRTKLAAKVSDLAQQWIEYFDKYPDKGVAYAFVRKEFTFGPAIGEPVGRQSVGARKMPKEYSVAGLLWY